MRADNRTEVFSAAHLDIGPFKDFAEITLIGVKESFKCFVNEFLQCWLLHFY